MEPVVLLGDWLSCNKFVTEDGELIKVTPYNYIETIYRKKFPIHCFITIDPSIDTIILVMEID